VAGDFVPVGEGDLNDVAFGDDVKAGEDVAIGVDDHAAAEGPPGALGDALGEARRRGARQRDGQHARFRTAETAAIWVSISTSDGSTA